jgi:hypothetical protein
MSKNTENNLLSLSDQNAVSGGDQHRIKASIELTFITSVDPLTKTYGTGENGLPEKESEPFLVEGNAARVHLSADAFAEQMSDILTAPRSNECLVLGTMSPDVADEMAEITTKGKHSPQERSGVIPLIWRGKDWLGYRDGVPAVLGLDHDAKDLPVELLARLRAEGGLLPVLERVCPAMASASLVSRPSVSTGIRCDDSGRVTPGGGLHVYLPVADGGDASSFVTRLHDRLLLSGWGLPVVTKSGRILIRSLVDTAASGVGERLWFEGAAVLREGLSHVTGARHPFVRSGCVLETRIAFAAMTDEDELRLRAIKDSLRASVEAEASEARKRFASALAETAESQGAQPGAVEEFVRRLQLAEERSVLTGKHELRLDHGEVVTVAQVLRDPASYHRSTCADPLEPEYGGGRNKAIIYAEGARATLFSQAHGGRLFALGLNESDVTERLIEARDDGDDLHKIMRALTPQVKFTAGGWREVARQTGLNVAQLLGFAVSEDRGHPEASHLPGGAQGDAVDAPADADERLDENPAIAAVLAEFNRNFAVVAEGGSVGVVRLSLNADLGIRTPVTMNLDAFKLLYGNKVVPVSEKQMLSAPLVWLRHEKRRTCPDGYGIDPDDRLPPTVYNLWQGFGVEEQQGNWSRLRALIEDVLAAGNAEHAGYIMQWLAHLAQRPQESPEVALVFRGPEGVGKGTLGRALMRLMRPHAMQITHSKHLTGPFNAHMRMTLFLFADEAFFAGDRANEGTLKGLITERYRINEAKGRDASLGRNRIHLMMASNNSWVVPASRDARRYAVFDVSPIHQQDHAYFRAIIEEMGAETHGRGVAAMLYDLRRMKLDTDRVRSAPETEGLREQRIASMRGPAKWWLEVLKRGRIDDIGPARWDEACSMDALFSSFKEWCRETREPYAADRHALGKFLSDMFQSHRPRTRLPNGTVLRPPGYRLGTLDHARSTFSKQQGIGLVWDESGPPTEAEE